MSSFLCFVCHSTVNADTNEDTREKYREVIGMHLCPDSHLCFICCHFLNKMCLFKSICLKRSLEYPVLFSEKGTINLQRSDIAVSILCPEDICLQHLNTRYHFYNNNENSQSDFDDNNYCELHDDRIFDVHESLKNDMNEEFHNEDYLFSTRDNIDLFSEELNLPNLEPVRITQNDLVNGEWTKDTRIDRMKNDTVLYELQNKNDIDDMKIHEDKIENHLNLHVDNNVHVTLGNIIIDSGVDNLNVNLEHRNDDISKITNEIVQNTKMTNEIVKNTKMINEIVENTNIINDVVDNRKITNENVDNRKITNEIVDNRKITNEFVKNTKMINNIVENTNITNEVVDNRKITNEILDNTKITNEIVKNTKMRNEIVDNTNITNEIVENTNVLNEIVDTSSINLKSNDDEYDSIENVNDTSNEENANEIIQNTNPELSNIKEISISDTELDLEPTDIPGEQKKKRKRSKKDFEKMKLTVKEQKTELEQARKEEKYISAAFKCYNCAISFHFKDSYQAHMMRHEESNGEYRCSICSLRFANPAVLRSHTANHSERYRCTRCENVVRAKQRQTHLRSCKSERDSVTCHLCGNIFQGASHLQQHLKRFHDSKSSNRNYLCNVCGKSYNNRAAVRTHMITHINRKFPCDECPATFSSPYTLNQHKKTHYAVEPELHYCTTCKTGYNTRKSLLAHLRNSLAHKESVYKCAVCARVCPSLRSLHAHSASTHARTHHLACAACSRTYSTRKALLRHLRSHKNEAPKQTPLCHACGEKFKSTGILKRHLKNVCEKDKMEEDLTYYDP